MKVFSAPQNIEMQSKYGTLLFCNGKVLLLIWTAVKAEDSPTLRCYPILSPAYDQTSAVWPEKHAAAHRLPFSRLLPLRLVGVTPTTAGPRGDAPAGTSEHLSPLSPVAWLSNHLLSWVFSKGRGDARGIRYSPGPSAGAKSSLVHQASPGEKLLSYKTNNTSCHREPLITQTHFHATPFQMRRPKVTFDKKMAFFFLHLFSDIRY